MVDYILETKPDVAICAGDISTSGEPSEFKVACDIFKPLIESPINFFFIPGNHDYYVKAPKCINAMKKAFHYLNQGRYNFDDLPYSLQLDDLDCCFVNESYPTNLVFSCGFMKKKTVEFISNWIDQKTAKAKVLVGHYPVLEKQPIMRFRHRLYGQRKIAKALRNREFDLSICGHVHKTNVDIDDKGRGEIIVGSVTRNACGALIEYNKDKDIFTYDKIKLE